AAQASNHVPESTFLIIKAALLRERGGDLFLLTTLSTRTTEGVSSNCIRQPDWESLLIQQGHPPDLLDINPTNDVGRLKNLELIWDRQEAAKGCTFCTGRLMRMLLLAVAAALLIGLVIG
ncbi:unnamed protein product, partial [Chrysoparadoxa australica]